MSHMSAPHLNNIYGLLQNTSSKIPNIYKGLILKNLPMFFHESLEQHICEVGKRQIRILNDHEKNINTTMLSEGWLIFMLS